MKIKSIRFLLISLLLICAYPLGLLAEPAMWRIEGDESTLYLFGTFHRLPEEVDWLSPEREEVLRNSSTLVLETIKSQTGKEIKTFLSQNLGIAISRIPLNLKLEQDTYNVLKEQMEAYGVSEAAFNRYQPWYAATLLTRLGGEEVGFYSEFGVESVLQAQAEETGKRLIALETAAQQLLFLADLPNETQVEMLQQTILAWGEFEEIYRIMFEAWIAGDIETTEQLVLEPLKTLPPMYQVLIKNRNTAWLEPLEDLLSQKGVHFVAVGTGHLVGPDSLIKLFEEKGYRVVRQ